MTELFNEKAKDWDANKMIKMLSSAIGSSILEHISLHDQMRVMDFGAGTGLISSQIAPLVKKIVAVDTSEAMLNKLSSKPELHGKVEIVCQDITDRPIDGKFDLIMSAMAMHHVKDIHCNGQVKTDTFMPFFDIVLSHIQTGFYNPGLNAAERSYSRRYIRNLVICI